MSPWLKTWIGLPCEDRAGEQEQRHVGPAPRAVHGEEAQAGRRQAVEMAVACAPSARSPSWSRRRGCSGWSTLCVLGQRQVAVCCRRRSSSRRTTRCVGRCVAAALRARWRSRRGSSARTPAGSRASSARPPARRGAAPRRALVLRNSACQRRGVGDVELVEPEAPMLQAREAVLLQLHRVVRREVVDADDHVAALEQALRAVHADEPGGAGDQHLHFSAPPRGAARAAWRTSCSCSCSRSRCAAARAGRRGSPGAGRRT